MSAFTNGFNLGFASGMFNRMFSSFNPFGCFGGFGFGNFFNGCYGGFNFPSAFSAPVINSSIFTQNLMPNWNFQSTYNNFISPQITSANFNTNLSMSNTCFTNTTPSSLNWGASDVFVRTNSASSSSTKKSSATFHQGATGTSVNRRVDTKCNLTAEQLNKSLKGVLSGKGQKFLDAEAKYGVNAAFLVAICNLESGHGTSNAAKQRNNVAGILPHGAKSFSSVDACIDYLGNLIANGKYYFTQGKKTIAQIGPTYCGPEWAPAVSKCMDNVYSKA